MGSETRTERSSQFTVTGINGQPVTSAKIRLYNVNASSKGGDFYRVSDNTWQEGTVTWNNAPAADATLLASLGSVSTNSWVEVDVTSLITGDGTYSLRISTTSTDGADYSSKEGANPPQLVIQTSSGPTNTPTATATPSQTLTPTRTLTPIASNTPTATPAPPFSNAAFVYDGDGKRVKSTINGTLTTYFVGAHYEVINGLVTKYYYAGSQRIAMRTNGTLNYLLGDHLGSTSLTTNASGQSVSELRYKAWGEVRYASGNTPTKYTYTGQYSYTNDFGFMYYGARWYDATLGRFNQPDSIVPTTSQGVQAYDRYAYTNNNPILYTDPTGHSIKPPPCLWCGMTFSYASANGPSAANGLVNSVLDMAIPLVGNLLYPGGVEVDPLADTVTFASKEDYYPAVAANMVMIGADLVPPNLSTSFSNTLDDITDDLAYRYVDDGEAAVMNGNRGVIPNVDRRGFPKQVSTSIDYYETIEAAENGLLLGRQNPAGPTNPPTYRATYLRNSVPYNYVGNSQTGNGIEMITSQAIKILRLEKLLNK